ncbi:MAG: iron chaperone [Candidatus Thorarchaeota archaeon]|jgi:uncharacterized protein YdhG (YjbR/CyaY superfamily)
MKSEDNTSIDAYLEALPEEKQVPLEDLRKIIKTIVPEAVEVISYKIPTFKYKGKGLVALSASKKHCSLHLMSPSVMKAHKDELKQYSTTTATIHFSADKPLPPALVEKLVKARIHENQKK